MSGPTIGILDSGIGGLSILREVRARLPNANLLYVADQAHLPYGPRSLGEVQHFAEGITRFLLGAGAAVIVIACNTASAAALHDLRNNFPTVPFVGMEPAVRPAARDTREGTIAVIATQATFQGQLYASLVERFANGLNVITRACPELVLLAERGGPWSEADYATVSTLLADIRDSGADHLALGCTHFTFVQPLIQAAIGDAVAIIDPAPAVARQTERVLNQQPSGQSASSISGHTTYMTTGNADAFAGQIHRLLGEPSPHVVTLQWQEGKLIAPKG